jgi:hypothetical protein
LRQAKQLTISTSPFSTRVEESILSNKLLDPINFRVTKLINTTFDVICSIEQPGALSPFHATGNHPLHQA